MVSEIIHFYHINDFHSHFEKWMRIRNFLQERKQLHDDVGEEVLILDIGDHVDRWHPFTEGSLGKENIRLLNEAGCQYATIGNNEGITLPYEALDELYGEAEFTVLAANLYSKNGNRPTWAHPYSIHMTKKGTKIALIGITAYFKKFYNTLGWELSDPYAELAIQLESIRKEADVIAVLSHLGLHEDEKIAADFPEIDLIFGAHTHHVLHEGKLVNSTLLTGAGKFGYYVGQVELIVDADKQAVEKKARLYDTNDFPETEEDLTWQKSISEAGNAALQEECTVLSEPIENDWFAPSTLSDLLCQALREWCEADCALMNGGLILEGLSAGKVTNGDLHRICPHPINPCRVELTGSELKEIILQSLNEEWPHMQIKGFGFRGKIMGRMVYDGIDCHFDEKKRLIKIEINGAPLIRTKNYVLALPDMFTFGYFFPQIKRSKEKEYYMPEFLRDLLAWKLRQTP